MTLLGNCDWTNGKGKQKGVEWREKIMKTRRRNRKSLHAQPLDPIPEVTSRIARASFPNGTLAIQLCDSLGPIEDSWQRLASGDQ